MIALKVLALYLRFNIEKIGMSATDNTTGNKADRLIKIALLVSPLLFLWRPFMGGLAPAIIWFMYRHKVPGIDEAGRKTMRLQVIWLVALMLFFGLLLALETLKLKADWLSSSSPAIIVGFYLANFILIIYQLIRGIFRP